VPLAANQQLYEYRIARVLGQGGFGTVYLAHDTLNHPNVVTVHALKVDGPNVYLVMEYVGDSLRGLLDKQGKLDIEQAVRITIDVCKGLAAVHAKDIVHRDIKPKNALLTCVATRPTW
jgi:serine/threonine protein kinase